MTTDVILALAAGLGLFLYGMKLMSDGLEKAAGAKLRSILEVFTKNRLSIIMNQYVLNKCAYHHRRISHNGMERNLL